MPPAIPLILELWVIALGGCLPEQRRGINLAPLALLLLWERRRRHMHIWEFCKEFNGNRWTAQFVRIEHIICSPQNVQLGLRFKRPP